MTPKINRHYYLDEKTKTIWHMGILRPNCGLIYMGTSDNHNIKMAAQVFMSQGKCLTGCKIKRYTEI